MANNTTTKNTPKTTTKNNTNTINTARTTMSSPAISTIFTTTTDLAVPTHYKGNNTETIDIAGEIIKEVQGEITSSPVFIPTIGLLFALIPVFVLCLCYARCWKRKKPKQIV